MSEVPLPEMRAEVIGSVQALSDPEYQWRVWVRREYPHPKYYDDLTMTYSILEDVQALSDPEGGIGEFLRNKDEARALRTLGMTLQGLFEKFGWRLPDEEYLRLPEWAAVVEAASAALTVLTAPDG